MNSRNVKLFYLLESVTALAQGSIIPAYVVFFRSAGVSLLEVAVLAAVFEATILVFELPTGKLADRYGRKLSVTIGFLLYALSGITFLYFQSFFGFLAAEILFGLGESFISGALEALTVDSLPEGGRESLLPDLFANKAVCRNGGLLAGMIGGGYLAFLALEWLFLPLTLLFVLALALSLFLIEKKRDTVLGEPTITEPRKLMDIIIGNRLVLALFGFGMLSNLALDPVDQFWQVLFDEILKVDTFWFGWITGAGLALSAILARILRKFYLFPKSFLSILLLVTSIGLFGSAFLAVPFAVVGIILFFTLIPLIRPVISTNLNLHFPSVNRAAALSSYNLSCSIGEVAAGLIAGVVVTKVGVGNYIMIAAAAGLVVVVGYFILYPAGISKDPK